MCDLKKAYALLMAVLRCLDNGQFDEAQAQLMLVGKALGQVAVDESPRPAAGPLAGPGDPFSRRAFAGDGSETEAVAGYPAVATAPETEIKQRGGLIASPGGSDDQRQADGDASAGAKRPELKKKGQGRGNEAK